MKIFCARGLIKNQSCLKNFGLIKIYIDNQDVIFSRWQNQKRVPCRGMSGGFCGLTNGLFTQVYKSIFTNRFRRIKATKFDRCHPYLAMDLRYFNSKITIIAVHICINTAFALVPINDLICRSCFISLKNISICQRLLYS